MNTQVENIYIGRLDFRCPYCRIKTEICEASISLIRVWPATKLSYCNSENYDSCPIFLAKLLRRR